MALTRLAELGVAPVGAPGPGARILALCLCWAAVPWVRAAVVDARVTVAEVTGAEVAGFSGALLGAPPAAWTFAGLPRKPPTRFSVVELDGAHVLKVEAIDSYGNLVHALSVQPSSALALVWRWRVDRLLTDADLRSRAADDAPVKVCLFFGFDAARLPFDERAQWSFAQWVTGQALPTQTLCYVWDNKLAVDTAMANAYTRRVRFIVLDSGSEKLGIWVAHRRDVVADYRRVFADEAQGEMPALTGVAIAADADNTHQHALAYVGDVSLAR